MRPAKAGSQETRLPVARTPRSRMPLEQAARKTAEVPASRMSKKNFARSASTIRP